jgi:hypothetical protein
LLVVFCIHPALAKARGAVHGRPGFHHGFFWP